MVIINDNNGEKFTFSPRFRSREPGHGAAGDSGKLRFVQSEILSITPLIKPKLRKTIPAVKRGDECRFPNLAAGMANGKGTQGGQCALEFAALDNLADPEESDWRLLCNVVHSFLRHQQTQYEQVLAAGADREELHGRISRAASRFFPWLKVERDPRTSREAEEKPEDFRPFDDFSRRLSDLVSERSRLTVAIKDARRKRLGREHIAELEERLARVNARAERLNDYFKPAVREETGTVVHSVCMEHSVRRYDFAGRELAECYTRSAGFKCPGCGKTVMRSKVPMEVGAGRRLLAQKSESLYIVAARL